MRPLLSSSGHIRDTKTPLDAVGSRGRGRLDQPPPPDAHQRARLSHEAQVRRSLDGEVARRGRTTPARPRSRVDGARPTPFGIRHERARAARTRHDPGRRSTRPAARPGPDRGRCEPRRGRRRMAAVHEYDRKRRPSTVRDYRIFVNKILVPAPGEAPIEAITSAHVDAFRTQLVAEDRLAARTINKYLALIHGILKRAQRVYGLSANAAAGVERQPVRRSGDFDVLSAEEVEALIRAAGSSQDAALYATAAYAGLRLGELRALRWRDVDFGKCLIHVRRSYVARDEGAPKPGRVRSVPMVDQVARTLDELSRREHFTGDEDLVFCNDVGNHFEDSALRRRF